MAVKDWSGRGTTHSDSPNREAPNRQAMGDKKYKEMIHKGNKDAEKKNLPFTFIKPGKKTQARRDVAAVCTDCINVVMVNENTVGTTCSKCKSYFSVEEDVNRFPTEEALVKYLSDLRG